MRIVRVTLLAYVVVGCADVPENTPAPSQALPETEAPSAVHPATPDPDHAAIDAWLTSWSTAQAASVRETCAGEQGCDPTRYEPSARPETSFGWDGAQSVNRIADWARGPRYEVVANARRLLVYLESGSVTGVHMTDPDGTRRAICRDADC
jgi:hypothetical protein